MLPPPMSPKITLKKEKEKKKKRKSEEKERRSLERKKMNALLVLNSLEIVFEKRNCLR